MRARCFADTCDWQCIASSVGSGAGLTQQQQGVYHLLKSSRQQDSKMDKKITLHGGKQKGIIVSLIVNLHL